MKPDNSINVEAFSLMAEGRGLTIENEDMLHRLYEGYCLLQVLLAQIPGEPDPDIEPALLFLGDRVKII
jgi:hypothetical protein